MATLEAAAAAFVRARMFEYAEDIYLRALLPLHESSDAFAKIASCHRSLAGFYQKIEAEGGKFVCPRYGCVAHRTRAWQARRVS